MTATLGQWDAVVTAKLFALEGPYKRQRLSESEEEEEKKEGHGVRINTGFGRAAVKRKEYDESTKKSEAWATTLKHAMLEATQGKKDSMSQLFSQAHAAAGAPPSAQVLDKSDSPLPVPSDPHFPFFMGKFVKDQSQSIHRAQTEFKRGHELSEAVGTVFSQSQKPSLKRQNATQLDEDDSGPNPDRKRTRVGETEEEQAAREKREGLLMEQADQEERERREQERRLERQRQEQEERERVEQERKRQEQERERQERERQERERERLERERLERERKRADQGFVIRPQMGRTYRIGEGLRFGIGSFRASEAGFGIGLGGGGGAGLGLGVGLGIGVGYGGGLGIGVGYGGGLGIGAGAGAGGGLGIGAGAGAGGGLGIGTGIPQGVADSLGAFLPLRQNFTVVGKGSYGCVVKPAPRCPPDTGFDESKVTKFQSEADARQELEIQNYIKQVDPHQRFTATFTASCAVSTMKPDDIQGVSGVCGRQVERRSTMITFNNAGVALGRFVNNMNKSRGYAATHVRFVQNVLAIFPHLFSGLAQLGSSFDRQRDFVHRLFYTHMDLNQGNILVKELTTGELEGRMIDFGFSMNIGRLIDVTPFRLQIRDHPRSRSHRRENYYVFTPPDFDVFNLVVGDPKQYGLIVEDCKYTRLVRFVYTRKSMVSNSLVLPQLADVRDLANYLSDEIGRDRTLDFRTAIQTFKNLRSTSSVSPYMLMPWNKVDVYQIGLNGLISSLDMLNMIRETYTISRRDEVEGYYTAINNACKVFRRCVTWNVFERLTANQARDELLSAARE